jgi:hypothetical protein
MSSVASRIALIAGIAAAVAVTSPAGADAASAPGAVRVRALPSPTACVGCWDPAPVTSWQWQLSGTVDTSVDVAMYDIDMFDNPSSLITSLHNDGRHVVCYISAGSREQWRPDKNDFPARIVGKPLDGWPGERYLDIRKLTILRSIMGARLDLCASKGFDAVEFDNVDAWSANTGFPLTRDDQLAYNAMLANMAHDRGLSAALKNDVEQVKQLQPYFDFALDEECFTYHECDRLQPFIDAGKAVFQVEYNLPTSSFCPKANAMNFNSLKKKLNLGPWREPCR